MTSLDRAIAYYAAHAAHDRNDGIICHNDASVRETLALLRELKDRRAGCWQGGEAKTSNLVLQMSSIAAAWQEWAGTSPHRCERGTAVCLHCRARATVNALRDAVNALAVASGETSAVTTCLHCRWPPGTPVAVSYDDGEEGEPGVIVANPELRVRFEENGPMEVVFTEDRLTRRAVKTSGSQT